MVGRRGEAPLVPPYILCNFKLDGAVGSSSLQNPRVADVYFQRLVRCLDQEAEAETREVVRLSRLGGVARLDQPATCDVPPHRSLRSSSAEGVSRPITLLLRGLRCSGTPQLQKRAGPPSPEPSAAPAPATGATPPCSWSSEVHRNQSTACPPAAKQWHPANGHPWVIAPFPPRFVWRD